MKLFYSKTSPYSRKVRMAVLEKGLSASVELVVCNPFEESPALKAANPLGKVPTLVLDDGVSLFDSPVICEYLDAYDAGGKLIPDTGALRWQVLRCQALADGIVDAAYNMVMEMRRPAQEQSSNWTTRWQDGIGRSLDAMETEISNLPEALTLAQLAAGSALGYLDFRLTHLNWRSGREATASWYETFATHPSMVHTAPQD